jgi:hypothetical protein
MEDEPVAPAMPPFQGSLLSHAFSQGFTLGWIINAFQAPTLTRAVSLGADSGNPASRAGNDRKLTRHWLDAVPPLAAR